MNISKNKTSMWGDWTQTKLLTHAGLAVFTLVGCGLAYLYEPTSQLNDIVALGTGYVALILLVVTLAIGPLNLMLKRRNGVNLNVRRDVGIWCGITGVIHAVVSFTLYNNGNLLLYFFQQTNNGYKPQFNLSSLSNFTGLLAALIMIVLLLTSNNLSLRWLKGKNWKFVQRFNYPLAILVLVHTIGYLILNGRETFFTFLLAALVIFTVEAQITGVVLTLWRDRKRETTSLPAKPAALSTVEVSPEKIMARRRFLVLTGVTVLTSVSSFVALGAAVSAQNQNGQPNNQSGDQPQTNPADTSNPNQNNAIGDIGSTASSTSNSANSQVTKAIANGAVLATLSSLPVGACTSFTTPDTGESAFLIHEQDGSVKAFSNMCTHRPYLLTYQPSQSQPTFYCALHGANFDVTSGQVLDGPPRYGLSSYKVQVDSQGNITYA